MQLDNSWHTHMIDASQVIKIYADRWMQTTRPGIYVLAEKTRLRVLAGYSLWE